MSLQVILNDHVPNLGQVGDIVEVANGYARNYLIPRNLAIVASARNVKQFEHTKRVVAAKRAKALQNADAQAKVLNNLALTIARQVGEEDKLFGSVTNRDIADALIKEGHSVDRRNITLEKPIKSLGVYPVEVKLMGGVKAEVQVFVVAE
jgi:large subunit ribosomal protein L9